MSRRDNFRSLYLDQSPTSWLVEIDDYFLQSTVSYYDLNNFVPSYRYAVSIIKGRRIDTSEMSKQQVDSLVKSCKLLYGLLHQRYVISEDGIRKLFSKYKRGVYGTCPRVSCSGKGLIPMGFWNEPGKGKVKCWCPQCHDIYNANSDLDGAFFGPDLPIMFHKISDIPIKYRPFNYFLAAYKNNDGKDVPEIKQRLYRWGEKKPELK